MWGRDSFCLGYFFFWCLFLLHCRFLSEFPLSPSLPHPPTFPNRCRDGGRQQVRHPPAALGRARLTLCRPVPPHTSRWDTRAAALTPKHLVGWTLCRVLRLGAVGERYKYPHVAVGVSVLVGLCASGLPEGFCASQVRQESAGDVGLADVIGTRQSL